MNNNNNIPMLTNYTCNTTYEKFLQVIKFRFSNFSCCSCALSMLLSVLFFVVVALILIAVACYFGLYKVEKGSDLDNLFNTVNGLTGKAKDQITN